MNYKQKYLKYKLKYLTSKKMYGGGSSDDEGDLFDEERALELLREYNASQEGQPTLGERVDELEKDVTALKGDVERNQKDHADSINALEKTVDDLIITVGILKEYHDSARGEHYRMMGNPTSEQFRELDNPTSEQFRSLDDIGAFGP